MNYVLPLPVAHLIREATFWDRPPRAAHLHVDHSLALKSFRNARNLFQTRPSVLDGVPIRRGYRVPTYPNQVFFTTSSRWFDDHDIGAAMIFHAVASKAGFRPVHYTGLKLKTREMNLDREARDDFYDSVAIVLFLGEPKSGSDWYDNWALPEMVRAIEIGKACFVYVSPNFPTAILQQYGVASIAKKVGDAEDFRKQLSNDLDALRKRT